MIFERKNSREKKKNTPDHLFDLKQRRHKTSNCFEKALSLYSSHHTPARA
tara:strand:- start:500 stop:649 length:150 start_codon:yes stop_codon:yes gene_type:complete